MADPVGKFGPPEENAHPGHSNGAKKECDPEDPMEFTGVAMPGNTMEAMAECFVEEFIMMGYTDDQLLKMFREPFYVAVNTVHRDRGEPFVLELIQRVRSRLGTFRFRVH